MTTKGDATKNRILEAAVDVLIRGGAVALNLDEILAATRTSKGQLFHYFPGGKTELLKASTSRQVERLLGREAPPVLDSMTAWAQWIEQVIALHEMQSETDSCEVAALAGRALDTRAEEREIVAAAFTHWHGLLRGHLEGMRDSGRLRPEASSSELASLVVSAMQGGAVLDKATGSREHLRHALTAAYRYLASFALHAPPSSQNSEESRPPLIKQ